MVLMAENYMTDTRTCKLMKYLETSNIHSNAVYTFLCAVFLVAGIVVKLLACAL